MKPPLVLRVQLEELRHTVVAALRDYQGEIDKAVAEETGRFVAEFDFARAIRKELEPAISQAVHWAVVEAVRVAMGSNDVRDFLAKRVTAHLRKELQP